MTDLGGRPTKYSPEIDQVVFDYMDSGLSIVQVARKLNVARSTIYKWADDNVMFSDTLTRAREASEAHWEYKFTEMMTSRDVNGPLVKLYFSNRFGWAETQHQNTNLEVSTPESISIAVIDATVKPD
jgi:hypothetical protein